MNGRRSPQWNRAKARHGSRHSPKRLARPGKPLSASQEIRKRFAGESLKIRRSQERCSAECSSGKLSEQIFLQNLHTNSGETIEVIERMIKELCVDENFVYEKNKNLAF